MPRLLRLATILVFVQTPAAVGDATTLKEIMQGLRDDLAEVADGLLRDDFDRVAAGAAAIAGHPRIPAHEVKLVAAELGQEMAAFKEFDKRVHDLAIETGAAARALDREAAISGYRRMIDICLACHDSFKARVAAVLDDTEASK